jgi:PP-loop superfamily ATP-utilizing enzyme
MRYLNVDDDYVMNVLVANKLGESLQLQESDAMEYEEIVESEEHVCPLCETSLEEAISEDSWNACVNVILETINEASAEVGDELYESEDEDEDFEEEE